MSPKSRDYRSNLWWEAAPVGRAKSVSFHDAGAPARRGHALTGGAREDEDFYNAPARVLTGKPRRQDDGPTKARKREIYRRTLIQSDWHSTTF